MPEDREHRFHHKHQRQHRAGPDVSEPTHELAPNRSAQRTYGDRWDAHREETADDREVARRVHEERGGDVDAGDQHAGDRRPDELAGLEQHRIQRDRVLQLPARHEHREERLSTRGVERGDRRVHETDQVDVPEGDMASDDKSPQQKGRHDR